ncbi:MAG: hypothetical protein Q7T89_08565 [Anaerolineales bacterium]|nr:hypothetical protein [Anaerolineales bacterium]
MTTQFGSEIFDKQLQSVQPQIIEALTNVRIDWELVAKGKSLLYHEGSIGLILFDIVTKLDVPIEEQRFLLGPSLFDEIVEFVTKQG